MKLPLYITVVFVLISCTASKIYSENQCSFRQGFMSYDTINDSTFSLKLQQLGKFYLNFILDSCRKINDREIELTGFISFPDPGNIMDNQRRIPDIDIFEGRPINKFILSRNQYLGKTDSTGKFNIKINVFEKETFILFNNRNLNRIAVQLSRF